MAGQPTSMIGHMYAAGNRLIKGVFYNPVSRFIGRTLVEMGERLISHGANEMGSAIFTGCAYAPPVLHTPHQREDDGKSAVQPKQQEQQQQVVEPPQQQATGWGHQATWGFKELGHRPDAKIIDMQPQVESRADYQRALESAASRGGGTSQARGRER